MNKIVLSNNIKADIDNNIVCEYINDDIIKKLNIKVLDNTKIKIIIQKDIKLDMTIEIEKGIVCDILEIKESLKLKIQNKYIIKSGSVLNITKLNSVDIIFERSVFNLKGNLNLILKTVSNNNEKYDITVNHLDSNTNSNIITHGVNENKLEFNVTTVINKGNKNCVANQTNRIINCNDNYSVIRPILLIDELDCYASHSALIGDFKDDEYFYIERLGIIKENAKKLLLEGFILSNCSYKKDLIKLYNKYWG